jgi:ATP:ADP antiporter, AAA family
MLYIPLQLDAKFRAKALLDVFVYRTSKGLLSLGLIGLQMIAGAALFFATQIVSLSLFAAWLLTVFFLFRKAEKHASA